MPRSISQALTSPPQTTGQPYLRGDLVGVAEMVEGRVADDDQVDLVELGRLGQRAGVLVEERVAQDAHARRG